MSVDQILHTYQPEVGDLVRIVDMAYARSVNMDRYMHKVGVITRLNERHPYVDKNDQCWPMPTVQIDQTDLTDDEEQTAYLESLGFPSSTWNQPTHLLLPSFALQLALRPTRTEASA